MTTEAQRKARNKYNQTKVKPVRFGLYPADEDIAVWLETINENKATYIKKLIREDMKRKKNC